MSMIGHNQPVMNVEALSPVDKERVKKALSEMNDSMTRASSERTLQKEIIDEVFDSVGLDKKMMRRMARVFFKANFNDEVEANNQFEDFYKGIVQAKQDTANNV
tara:strand:- start:42407 stop:42718 length:312 start_codon:yes stop_codon:yes gene_type:complete